MKKKISYNLITIITLIVVSCMAYSLLLHENFLHASIASILSRAHHLELKQHLIVLAFIPIYIAVVIFGSFLLGIYLSSTFKQFISRCMKKLVLAQKKAY